MAPQMPALAFSLAILARFGPAAPGVEVFLIPAPALAVDQREPKASPLAAEDLAAGLVLKEGVDEREGLDAEAGEAVDWGAGTEVK